METQFDLFQGRERRDEGTQRRELNDLEWAGAAQADFLSFLRTRVCATSDASPQAWLERGLPDPSHPNSWGAVAISLCRRVRIEWTGEVRQATMVRSHARTVKVWKIAFPA